MQIIQKFKIFRNSRASAAAGGRSGSPGRCSSLFPTDGRDHRKRESNGVSAKDVPELKKLLAAYYEGESIERISDFMRARCWKNF